MNQLPLHKAFKSPPPPRVNRNSDLPILQKAADAYKLWHDYLQHFPRLSRYTLGTKIDALFLDTVELILLAGYSTKDQKLAIVNRAAMKLDATKFFLQTAWEMKFFDNKKYALVSEPLSEVGKMLGGWRKQLQNETPSG